MDHAQLKEIEAVIDYVETNEFPKYTYPKNTGGVLPVLKHCADVYVLAQKLRMQSLMVEAVDQWNCYANACGFGHFTIPALKDLLQHICSTSSRQDTGIRVAAFRLAAAYHRKYLAVGYAIFLDGDACRKGNLSAYKAFFQHRRYLPQLEAFMMSEEPLAWQLATMYERDIAFMAALEDN